MFKTQWDLLQQQYAGFPSEDLQFHYFGDIITCLLRSTFAHISQSSELIAVTNQDDCEKKNEKSLA